MSKKPQIELHYATHRSENVVCYRFERNPFLIEKVRQLPDVRWSQTKGCWIQPKIAFNLNQTFEHLKPFAVINYDALMRKNQEHISAQKKKKPNYDHRKTTVIPDEYVSLMTRKRLSEDTIRTYTAYFKDFCFAYKDHDLTEITKEDINHFITKLIKKYNISESEQNQRINAIKYYYEKVLERPREFYFIDRPTTIKKLPDVLSKSEVLAMIQNTSNIKHKSMLALMYSTGIRRSEVQKLKPKDIDSERMLVKVLGKGKKERLVPLSNQVLYLLRDYISHRKENTWLFEGNIARKPLSASSIEQIVKKSAIRAGVKKRVYPHILRHSFATHHIEQGTDIRYIQTWLGHESSKTTEIYTHVSETTFNKFKNPIDDFDIT